MLNALRQTWLAMWALLAFGVSVATGVALVKRGLSIPVHGPPQTTLEYYEWVRNNVFDGIYYTLDLVWSVRLADWIEDAIGFYLFFGFSLNRALVFVYGKAASRVEQMVALVCILVLWPLLLIPPFLHSHPPHIHRISVVDLWNYILGRDGARRIRYVFPLMLIINGLAAATFFTWNHFAGIAGG